MDRSPACSHCDAPLTGPFCAACGQKVRLERLTTPRLLREGLAEILDLEAGLLPTLRVMLLAPERVVRGWWHGHTRPWVHPAKFFLVSFAVAQFVAWRTGALADFASGFVTAGSRPDALSASSVEALLAEYFVLFVGGGLVLPVVAATLLGRRTLAEQTVFAAFVFGELALFGSVALVVGALLPGSAGPWAVMLLAPAYLGWSIRSVFETGWTRTALATAGLLLGSLAGSTFIAGVLSGASRAAGAG